jgi:cysteinyl-tRNA synthetase
VIAIEPVPAHKISGLKNLEETCVPGILDRSVIDEILYVDDAQARDAARRLHCEDALMVGSSGAAIVAGALRYLDGRSGLAVAIAPDSSQKAISYLAEVLEG